MDRPTFFLSSTIFDFEDLRGALKDYLELRGGKVLASEFTDFDQPLDKHSYEACLKTIEKADFFVLFIGRRVGGWFDADNQISITRAEYRHAYQLARAGKIRILCFVRSNVWNHRQSIRDLEKALKNDPALSVSQREKLVNHPTLAMDNANAIIGFIDEITKNKETAKAVSGLGEAPIANWVWPFSTFGEVRQAIDPLVLNGNTVLNAAGRKTLEEQLYTILQGVLPKVDGIALNPINSVLRLRTSFGVSSDNITNKSFPITKQDWSTLSTLLVYSMNVEVDYSPLQAHLSSGLLLDYEPTTGTYRHTEEFDMLVRVIEQGRLLSMSGKSGKTALLKYGAKLSKENNPTVPAIELVEWMHRLLRWVDFIQATKILARSLAGKPQSELRPVPKSPLIDQEEELESEELSLEQVRAFVND